MTTLITGGTGSFGTAFAEYLLNNSEEHIRIFSRDEHKQEKMSSCHPAGERLSYCLGDIRDLERLKVAMEGVNTVVHAAAYKTVPNGERHGGEFVKTNIDGSANVITAAIARGVQNTILISSDKAVMPINLYGFTKGVAESLFIQANTLGAARGSHFSVARGGNVWGSAGSVIPKWREQKEKNSPITLTDPDATRFHLPMPYWTKFISNCLEEMTGGEIFIPKCNAWNLGELADAFDWNMEVVGARGGDKQHETLISPYETERTFDLGWAYAIAPSSELRKEMRFEDFTRYGFERVKDFVHTSEHADRLSVEELRILLNEK